MASDLLLPLFPLEVVLLPEARLPLHIFEERYKLMIGEAMEGGSEFGVVFSKEQSVVNVGCTAAVETVARTYPDGRLDIVTRGRRRFEILFLDDKKPYLQAAAHFFEDEEGTAAPPEAGRRLNALFEKAVEMLPSLAVVGAAGNRSSFQIAGVLPLELELKQRLLGLRSERERVDILLELLEKLLPRLDRARKVERVSRGNGQGR